MASSAQLKKRLRGVSLTAKLSRAMKTVASAKYAKASRLYAAAQAAADETAAFAPLLPAAQTAENGAPPCFILLGYGRGLCGGYNLALHGFAGRRLAEAPGAVVFAAGKRAAAYLAEAGIPVYRAFFWPDVPAYADFLPLAEEALSLFRAGKVSAVHVLYQAYVNTLTQTPAEERLLPLPAAGHDDGQTLFLPSCGTAAAALEKKLYETAFAKFVFEASVGAQAATLAAMRTASDNAEKAAARLENEINRKRQNAVTAGVLETAGGAAPEKGETDG